MSDPTTTLLDDPTSGQYYRIVDLPPVELLTGDEVIEVVQDGESRQASLSFLKGVKGDDGLDAYEVALEHGFEGSAEEWLDGLKGKSAYDLAMSQLPVEQHVDLVTWLQSLNGEKGDRGASILLGDYDPSALDGAPNDVWMNTLTQSVWLKATTTLWNHIGTFGGGNVYSPSGDKPMVRVGPDWVELEVKEAPKDGKNYVRRNGQWVVVDRYDLAMISSTGEVDAAVGNRFVMENGAAGTRALSFKNLPANRAMTLVVFVRGNTGTITWPAEVKWINTLAPELGTNVSIVIIFWDGVRFLGTSGAVN